MKSIQRTLIFYKHDLLYYNGNNNYINEGGWWVVGGVYKIVVLLHKYWKYRHWEGIIILMVTYIWF